MLPTVILSDLHLGRPRGAALSADALRPLWAGARRLVVNGDTAEVHHPAHRPVAVRETLRLADLCAEDGVELVLLSGNHDPWISDTRHLHLRSGLVFVTHGDVLHPAISPWSPAAARMRAAHDHARSTLNGEPSLADRLSISQHAASTEWDHVTAERLRDEAIRSTIVGMLVRPWALAKVLHYWHIFPKLASRFVAKHAPSARFAVFGHTHRPGVWHRDGRTIINTGSFGFTGRPRAVIVGENELVVTRIERRGGMYVYAGDASERFELAAS